MEREDAVEALEEHIPGINLYVLNSFMRVCMGLTQLRLMDNKKKKSNDIKKEKIDTQQPFPYLAPNLWIEI